VGWLLLGAAIVLELVATMSLKASDGMSRWGYAALTIGCYVSAFYLLSLALRSIGIGPAYAIWSGVGTVGAAVLAYLIFGERMTPLTIGGAALVVVGVVVMGVGVAAAEA
jgi:small multidrug resistance pump